MASHSTAMYHAVAVAEIPERKTLSEGSSTLVPYQRSARTTTWSPPALHLASVIVFVVYNLVLIALLEVFIRLSPYSPPPNSGIKFAWTYLPTACIMLAEWVWAAYDLQVKLLTPWDALSRGVAPAKVWRFDYVGWNYFVGLRHAVSNLHLAVLLCYLGVWLVALASVASTSLWTIQTTSTSPSTNLVLALQLNPDSSFWMANNTIESDASYITPYLGHVIFGLARSPWVTADNIIMEPFSLPSTSSYESNAAALQAQTKGYSASMNCSSASATFHGDFLSTTDAHNSTAYLVDVEAVGCTITYNLTWVDTVYSGTAMGSISNQGPNKTWDFGFVFNHTCPGSSPVAVETVCYYSNNSCSTLAAIACASSYTEHTVDVTVSLQPSTSVTSSVVPGSSKPCTFSGADSVLQWVNTVSGTLSMVPGIASDLFNSWPSDATGDLTAVTETANVSYSPWIWLLVHATNITQDDLRNAGKLQNATISVFEHLWPDFAQAELMADAGTSSSNIAMVQGAARLDDLKLKAHPLSVRLAQGALSALIFVVIGVYILRPRSVLPRDPSSLAGLAALMAAKDSLTELDRATSEAINLQEKYVASGVSERQLRFDTTLATVKAGDPTITPIRHDGSDKLELRLWRPFVLHPVTSGILVILVVGTIIALQFTYRFSVSHHGFTDSDVQSSVLQTLRAYVAPIYIFILVLMLSSYLSGIRILDPYIMMSRKPTPARSSVTYAPAAHTEVGLMWHAAKHRSLVGICCAAVLMTLPFLKIAVAGLLVTTTTQHQSTITLDWTGTFNTSHHFDWFTLIANGEAFASALQGGCPYQIEYCPVPGYATVLSQVPQYGLALPDWVTPTDAVGIVDLDPLDSLPDGANVTVPLPTISGRLTNCSALEPSDYNYTIGFLDNIILPGQNAGIIIQLPPSINPVPCSNANDWACPKGQQPQQVQLNLPSEPGYFGEINALYGQYLLYYGKTEDNNATQIANLSIVACGWSMVQSTKQVTITKSNTSSTPLLTIDQSSAKDTESVFNATAYGNALPWMVFSGTPLPTNASQALDTFLQIVTVRNSSLPLNAYLDPTHMIPAAQELYAAYWALYAHVFMRLPVNGTDAAGSPGQALSGTVLGTVTRVSQAAVPTRVIQALLGAILVCALASAMFLRSSGKMLPFSPTSIGAQMRLIVGGRFAELEVLGEDVDNRELERALDGRRFALGWSKGVDGMMRFGVDISDEVRP